MLVLLCVVSVGGLDAVLPMPMLMLWAHAGIAGHDCPDYGVEEAETRLSVRASGDCGGGIEGEGFGVEIFEGVVGEDGGDGHDEVEGGELLGGEAGDFNGVWDVGNEIVGNIGIVGDVGGGEVEGGAGGSDGWGGGEVDVGGGGRGGGRHYEVADGEKWKVHVGVILVELLLLRLRERQMVQLICLWW